MSSPKYLAFQKVMWQTSVRFALLILFIVTVAAVFSPLLANFDPTTMSIRNRLTAPNATWWLGTDEFGRDVYSRLLYAGRVSLAVGMGVSALSALVGIFFGLLAGFFKKLDAPISYFVDAMMSFPDILLAIALVAALGGSLVNIIIAISFSYIPRIIRIVRASTLVIKRLTYVESARSLGVPTWQIFIKHIIPNMISPIIVQCTFIFSYAILAEAGLSFLGIGADPSIPTWGTMITAGHQYAGIADWTIIAPGITITLCVIALQIVGDGLRDALDPRISKEV